ncbi:MAG: transcriptional repressor LexA [Kiloniellales bacterium]|nr:transcriptional repressor LexA [Kiloniellales bacterium]
MLTKKQHQLLLYIHNHLSTQGVSPSFDEMKDALDLKSKSGIHRLVTGLVERGFIRRLPHRARALEVLRLPDGSKPGAGGSFAPKVIEVDFTGQLSGSEAAEPGDTVQLPLYGKIAAGTPIEALRDYSNFVDVPSSLLRRGEHYALEVEGDSMVDAGILDGDTVLIQRRDVAENGSIVVALVDNEEATLKRFRKHGNSIALEPANKEYETRIFPADRVSIQGCLVGLIRSY